jgi:uncharacterized membrane protein YjfL (UPF0719 family)
VTNAAEATRGRATQADPGGGSKGGDDATSTRGPQAPSDATLARALRRAGGLIAVGLIVGPAVDGALGAVVESGPRAGLGWAWAATFAVCGTTLMALAAGTANRIFLAQLGRQVRAGNMAAAIVSAGHAIAFGILTSACFSGRGWHDLALSATFFLIAAVSLLALQGLFRWRTRYADDQEVLGHNAAAALAFAGATAAFAIIVGHAAEGDFLAWRPSLIAYGRALLLAVALYPVRQIVVQRWLLRLEPARAADALDRAVAQSRDLRVAAVEAAAYLAVALWATGIA